MKIKTLFLLPVVATLVLSGLLGQVFLAFKTGSIQENLIILVSGIIEENTIDGQIQRYIESKATIFDEEVKKTALKAAELASVMSHHATVFDAYEIAHSGDISDPHSPQSQKARELLRESMLPILKAHQQVSGSSSVLNLHFHLPNGRSLVRLWREGYQVKIDGKKLDLSDDISSFRKTVMDINSGTEKSIGGIEVGRGGFAIRGLCKIINAEGVALGSNEVLLAFDEVTKMLLSSPKEAFEVYMDERLLEVARKLKDPKAYPNRGGNIRIRSTNSELGDQLFDPELAKKAREGVVFKKTDAYYVGMFPVPDYSGKTIGIVALYIPLSDQKALIASIHSDMDQSMGSIKWINLVVNIASLLIVAVVIWIISSRITHKTQKLTASMDAVTEGDLTHAVDARGIREYSEISDSVNSFLGRLKQSFRLVFAEISSLIAYSDALNSSSEMASEGANIMDENTRLVMGATTQMESNASEISASVDSLTEGMNSISSAIEQLNASFHEISNSCIKESQIATEASGLVGDANDIMTRMSANAEEIGSVVDIIRDIADQTNLLALNATIEAASAGDAGKGFAVVASEVKDLAKQCSDAAGKISKQIKEVQDNSRVASESINKVTEVIDSVSQYSTSIASSVEEQSAVTDMISKNVVGATDSTLLLQQSVEQTMQAIHEMVGNIGKLRKQAISVSGVSNSNLSTAEALSVIAEEMRATVTLYNAGGCRFDITKIKHDHILWDNRLSAVISGKESMKDSEVSSSKHCEFGKWIASIEDAALKKNPHFVAMVDTHDQVHFHAAEVVRQVNSGDFEAAKTAFRNFQETRMRLFQEINALYVVSEVN